MVLIQRVRSLHGSSVHAVKMSVEEAHDVGLQLATALVEAERYLGLRR